MDWVVYIGGGGKAGFVMCKRFARLWNGMEKKRFVRGFFIKDFFFRERIFLVEVVW